METRTITLLRDPSAGRPIVVRLQAAQTPSPQGGVLPKLVRLAPTVRASRPVDQDLPAVSPALVDNSPAARARRVRRKLRRLFADARERARGKTRLRRKEEYRLLKFAYAAVRRWRDDGIAAEAERELRAEAQVAISRSSSLFLVLIRSALPRLDPKRASKWTAALVYADEHEIGSKRLIGFLHQHGGIEGAARARANARKRGDL